MEYFLNDRQKELQISTRHLAVEKIKPVRAQHDRDGTFPWEIIEEFINAGLFKIYVPEEYGGTGSDVLDLVIVIEELSRICGKPVSKIFSFFLFLQIFLKFWSNNFLRIIS